MRFNRMIVLSLALISLTACAGNFDPEAQPEDKATGMETEQNQAAEEPEIVTMYIDAELRDCEGGAGPQKCMRVRFDQDEDWLFFYDQIEGFEFKTGNRYTLLVEKHQVENPPADASSLRYVLAEVVSAEEVDVTNFGGLYSNLWKLHSMGSESSQHTIVTGSEATFELDPANGSVAGTTGCNRYFGPVELNDDQKTIRFGALGMTRMACSEELNQQEYEFMRILEKVTHYSLEGERLTLFTDGEQQLVFEAGK